MALDFETLTEASFRGTSFPVISIVEIGSQNMPAHKKADRDGARVEGTGLNPFKYQLKIPFLSTIQPGPEAQWVNLFPETYFQMKEHFKNRSTGYLIHPLYGGIRVKPISWHADMNAESRSGIIVDMVFMETTEDDQASIVNTSYKSTAITTAVDLDKQLSNLKAPPVDPLVNPNLIPPIFNPEIMDDSQSFEEFVNSLTAITDKGTLIKNQFNAKIDAKINALNKLKVSADAIETETNPTTGVVTELGRIGNGTAAIHQNATKLILSLLDFKSKIIAQDKQIGFYVTPKNMSKFLICGETRNTIKELNELNDFPRGPIIQKDTLVKFYQK